MFVIHNFSENMSLSKQSWFASGLCILVDFPIQMNALSIGVSIKGSKVSNND